MRTIKKVLAVVGVCVVVSWAFMATARAAAGCQVTYTVSSQWTGGFTAAVSIRNLGDPINGWRLGWTFPAGQAITQSWGFTANPASGSVIATNVDYTAVIGTGAAVDVGFNGSWTGSNPVPAAFTLNGTTCTGGVVPTTSPAPSSPAPSSPAPSKPTVAADGTGTYRTVQAAVDAVPADNTTRRVITIKAGTYREQVIVPKNKPFITLEGLGSDNTRTTIIGNRDAGHYGAQGSATVQALGHDVIIKNLTITNDYDEDTYETGDQALAAFVDADRAIVTDVRFLGDQDTLRVHDRARAYFLRTYVEGTVDFVYGGGIGVFNASTIHEKRSSGGPITAADTAAAKPYGLLFYKCTITGTGNNVTTLGRPWAQSAHVVYRESTLSATVKTAQPWTDMGDATWKNARFFEYRNTGAGATVNSNRPQLTDAQAATYTPQKYLAGSDGWNPVG